MPGGDVIAQCAVIRKVGSRHPQRLEDVLTHVVLVALSRDATDELTQRDIAEIRIPHPPVRSTGRLAMTVQKISRELPRVKLAIVYRMHPPQRERIRQTRCMA